MKPVNGYVIIIPKKPEEKTKSGLVLLPKEIDQDTLGFGTIYAVCEDSAFSEGQEVIYNKYVPCEWKMNEETYYSMKESEIIAVL